MNFKSIFSTFLFVAVFSVSAAANGLPTVNTTIDVNPEFAVLQAAPSAAQEFAGTCTVNIDTTLDDGTTVSGTIVIQDIGWVECAIIKITDFFSGDF